MSKRKRARRERGLAMDFFAEAVAEATEDALEFIEQATPLEMSQTLAELGVSTTHRSGIEEFLRTWRPPADDPEAMTPFEALAEKWIEEIQAKRNGKAPQLQDDILLVEVARFYWFRFNSGQTQVPA